MWSKLVVLMTDITDFYQTVLELSQKKKEALVAAQVGELDRITRQEEALLLESGKLEAAREKLVEEIAVAHGLKSSELTLTKAQTIAGPKVAGQLQGLEERLAGIIGELAPLNKLNTELIQQSLDFVQYNLNLLSQNAAGTNYAPGGQGESAPRPRTLIDAKV